MPCLSPLGRVVLACSWWAFLASGAIQFGLMACTLTTVQEHFDLSYTAIAIAIVCVQISQVIASIFLPSMEQRWPSVTAELICGIGMILCTVGALMYGLAIHYSMLIISQLLSGAGAGACSVLMPSMYARLVSSQAMISLAIAKAFTLTPVGIVAASVSCSFAVEYWRWLYVGFGSLLLIPATIFIWIHRGYKEHDPRHKVAPTPTFAEVRDTILKSPVTMLSIGGITCTAFMVAAASTFLPAYIEKHLGHSKMTAGLVMASTVPSVAISTMIGGKLSEWLGWTHRKLLLFTCGASGSAFALLMCWFPGDVRLLGVVIGLAIVIMFFIFLEAGPAVAVIAQFMPRHMVSYGQSIVNSVTRCVGGIGGPLIMAAILDSGLPYNMAYFTISWVLLLGCILYGLSAYLCPSVVVIDHGVPEDGHAQNAEAENVDVIEIPLDEKDKDTEPASTPGATNSHTTGSCEEYSPTTVCPDDVSIAPSGGRRSTVDSNEPPSCVLSPNSTTRLVEDDDDREGSSHHRSAFESASPMS